MPDPTRVYWDAAAWIAYIQKEMPGPDSSFTEPRFEMCRAVLEKADARKYEIVTSAFTLSEVCKRTIDPASPAINLAGFFDQPYILTMNVDKEVGMKAQSLQLAGVAGLRPADAIHVASALVANVPIFHTFDAKLIKLDGLLTLNDGNQLSIMFPSQEDPMPELLKGMLPNG